MSTKATIDDWTKVVHLNRWYSMYVDNTTGHNADKYKV